MDVLTGVLIFVAWSAELVFVVRYWRVTRWRRSDVGRMIMVVHVSLLLVISLGVLATVAPNLPARPFIRLGSWALVAGALVWQALTLVRNTPRVRGDSLPDSEHTAQEEAHHGD